MHWIKNRLFAVLLALGCVTPGAAAGEELTVAVAANFAQTLRALVAAFEQETGHQVNLVVGSSGKHYAQIRHGAPFDVFFAADVARPARLEQEGLTATDSRFTYAEGRLVLWSPEPGRVDAKGALLKSGNTGYLAIANPKLAPYGKAAQSVLQHLNLWQVVQNTLVQGENVAQTLHFVESGAADMGFVAVAQVQQPDGTIPGSYWLVPSSLHPPIEQQAVILNPSPAATALMKFVRSPRGRDIIESYGYETADLERAP